MSSEQPRRFELGAAERSAGQRPSLEEELAAAEGLSPDAAVEAAEPYVPTATYRGPLPPVVARRAGRSSPSEPPLVALQSIPNKPVAAAASSSGWVVGLLLALVGGGLLALLFCGGLALALLLRFDSSPAASGPPVYARPSTPVYRPPSFPSFDSQAMHDEMQRTLERQRAESERMMEEIRAQQQRRQQEHEQLMRQQFEDSRRRQQELVEQLRRSAP